MGTLSGKKTGLRAGRAIPRAEADPAVGLSAAEVKIREENNYLNTPPEPSEKRTGEIFTDNIFTYFNLIFAILAVAVGVVGAFNDLTFIPVILLNSAIGIVQELRSRAALRKMKFITASQATVIRGGSEQQIPPERTVLDDIVVFAPGGQIYADAVVIAGTCRVNEALVTGESDEVDKNPGDELLSGSFIVSGNVKARLTRVGRDSFVAGLALEAKKTNKKNRSEMMNALNKLVRTIGFIIIPLGALMIFENLKWLGNDTKSSVTTTAAAIIGMIPEGLYFLVSIALTVSVMRLAKRRVLVHEMRCIETLARVDTLCVDKTGTITQPEMQVREVISLNQSGSIAAIMADFLRGGDENETALALKRHFTEQPQHEVLHRLPFSSATKYSGAQLSDGTCFLLGAPEKLLPAGNEHLAQAQKHAENGYRVLLLARSRVSGDIAAAKSPAENAEPLALILLTNLIRESAVPTFKFFAEQGVEIKVISGDNPATVSKIAQDAGIANAQTYIDASELKTERHVRKAVSEYTVFGRVTPDMKRKLVRAMQAEGRTVAMTGDGVNDVLALKDANVGIAMASGSEAASQIAELVLLDNDFSAMTNVVSEGRRVINNIERSSTLYIMKNIFSFVVALLAVIMVVPFPITPSQLTLYNMVFIGIPSFVLALQPNKARVRGRFMINVMLRALPAGLTDFFLWLAITAIGRKLGYSTEVMATMTSITMSFIALVMMIRLCVPVDGLRLALLIAMPILYAVGSLAPFLKNIFATAEMDANQLLITGGLCLAATPVCVALMYFGGKMLQKHRSTAALYPGRPKKAK